MESVVRSNVVNFNIVRANKKEDNTLWTPRDALEYALKGMDEGEFDPTQIVIAYRAKDDNDEMRVGYILSHVSQDEVVAMLEKAKLVALGLFDG